jgi:hypothetical protein
LKHDHPLVWTTDRTVEDDAMVGSLGVAAHFEASRTKGNAFVIELLGRAGRIGMLTLSVIEDDDGADLFDEQAVVDARRIVTGVIAG